jgi:hypothetical protein
LEQSEPAAILATDYGHKGRVQAGETIMNNRTLLGAVLAASLASPAIALEHEVVIDHAAGPIAADYKGSVSVKTTQVGSAGVAGRPSTLACRWTATLNVERVAKVGENLHSRRVLTRDEVTSGSKPGWCETNTKTIDRLVDGRTDNIRNAMLALVEEDRAAIVAEADSVTARTRG